MRLVTALSEGNPEHSSASNRSGTGIIRVRNSVGEPGLAAYEVDGTDATKPSPLFCSVSADAVEHFLDQQGYNLDADEWYPD